jgi:3-hydroxyacyl-[acyl-carrier-protein] dehydratase
MSTTVLDNLPHRKPFRFVTSIDQLEPGKRGVGVWCVDGGEDFFSGHFPGNPVVPGVIQCEIIAQASCMLMKDAIPGGTPYYAGINSVRFRRPVRPGDTITVQERWF